MDNLHANGVVANVDIETGLVDYPAVDNKSTKYLYHPYSHEQIVGFKVPNWNQLKAEIIKIATITPDVKYVGWDIAVLNAGIELIEGNHDPAHELTQMINQNGNYKTIRNVWSKR